MWRDVRVVAATGSTNADVAAAARAGAPEGLVVVAEQQHAGRGRLGRSWVSPPRAALTLSMLFRPGAAVPAAARPLLPLLVATAVAGAASERTDVDVRLKWPNDLVVPAADGDHKVAGLLAEVVADAVVVGVGLNVSTRRDELPRADATSLALACGQPVDRLPLLLAILRALERSYAAWRASGGAADAVLPAYRRLCATLGRRVRVELPGGAMLVGEAVDVDGAGRLVVATDGERHVLSAGDVVHLRPAR